MLPDAPAKPGLQGPVFILTDQSTMAALGSADNQCYLDAGRESLCTTHFTGFYQGIWYSLAFFI